MTTRRVPNGSITIETKRDSYLPYTLVLIRGDVQQRLGPMDAYDLAAVVGVCTEEVGR